MVQHKVYEIIVSRIKEKKLKVSFSTNDLVTTCPEIKEGKFKLIRLLKYGLE